MQNQFASIFGQLRVLRGDFPSHQIQIELLFRGARVGSVYADTEGKFGFNNLVEGEYHLIINDEAYEPVDDRLEVRPEISMVVMASLILHPRENAKPPDLVASRANGSNANMVDLAAYNKGFPHKAVKEYDKGIAAGRKGDHKDAILHYQAALEIAQDYYPAHNNLGSEYLSESDLPDAKREFQQVIRLNQADAAGYFNLSNVCMMMGQLEDAQNYLSEGMRREPDSALGHFLLGSLEIRQGEYEQAEAMLRQTIQLSPTMAQARLQLVNVLLQRGKRADAVAELRSFVATFPESSFTAKAKQLIDKLEKSAEAPAAAR